MAPAISVPSSFRVSGATLLLDQLRYSAYLTTHGEGLNLVPLRQKLIDLADDFTGMLEAFLDLLQQLFGVCSFDYFSFVVRHSVTLRWVP